MAHLTLREAVKLRALTEKTVRIDETLRSSRATRLITEAMDEEDLKKAGTIIDQLRSLSGHGFNYIDVAIGKAVDAVNKSTGGGPLDKAWNKIKGLAGKNPVVNALILMDTLQQGFNQAPQILKNNLGSPEELKRQKDKSPSQIIGDDKEKLQSLTAQLKKAFRPKGVFGVFKTLPYITEMELVEDLLNARLGDLEPFLTKVRATESPQQVAQDMKSSVTGSDEQTTKPTEPATGAPATEKPETGKAGVSPLGKNKPTQANIDALTSKGPGVKSELPQDFVTHYVKKLKDVDPGTVEKVIRALHAGGQLKR